MNDRRSVSCEEATESAPLYVVGALEASRSEAVRAHLETCSRPHREFAELGSVAPYLAQLPEPREPSPALRDRLMAAIAAEAELDAPAIHETAVGDDRTRSRGVPAESARRRGETWLDRIRPRLAHWALPAAAVLLIGVLSGWNLLLQADASAASDRAELLREIVTAANAPGAEVARLAGTEAAPGASGLAVLRPEEEGYLVLTGVGRPPAGKVYQAWYMRQGIPRSAGLVHVGADGLGILPGLRADEPVDAIAITIENAGGVEAPTTPPIAEGVVGG